MKSEEEKAQLQAIDTNYAVISFSTDGTILDANENFLNALGYRLNEIVGHHHRMFCDSDYTRSREYSEFWDSLQRGVAQTSEFRRIKKNGESIFIQASYMPIRNGSGNIYKVVKFAQDITERKLESLYFSGQIDAIDKSQAVIEFDMSGTIVNANENFLNTLGYRLNEIVGKHHSMFCTPEYKNSSAYQQFWRKLNNGEFDAGEYLRLGKNGKEIWIHASYNPIFGIDGKPMRVVKYATDITAKKNMMFKVEDNVQELSKSLDNLSKASHSMSKEAQVTMNGSQEVSVSITQINQAVSEVSEKIESMLSSISSISSSSTNAKTIAVEASEQSKSTTSNILKLTHESEKIEETIHAITQIAFQTNILSLNAAVEAATAGEAGKGFAVVAQEVRNLASRSDEAAKEVTGAVELIQSLVKSSLDSIQKIDNTIKDISEMSTNISDSIAHQENISNQLASTALEASQGVNEVTNTMVNVSHSAQETQKESLETLQASEQLIKVSSELISILRELK
jgi:methyl-accepting chemotaxis protein